MPDAWYWARVLAPNPNIPFKYYLKRIGPPHFSPPHIPSYPLAQANLVLRPKPRMLYPCNAMLDALHFKSTAIDVVPSQCFTRENHKRTGFVRTYPAEMETNIPPKEKNTNLKKYKCKQCGRCFSRSNTLVTHERIHTGEKPFKCEQCHRRFRQHGNLTRHKVIHTNSKPFACLVCQRAFNRKSNLKTHIKIHRPENVRAET